MTYLYIAPDVKKTGLKIGFSLEPNVRLNKVVGKIDFDKTYLFNCLNNKAVEKFCHKYFDKFRIKIYEGDGDTEWFNICIKQVAMDLIFRNKKLLGIVNHGSFNSMFTRKKKDNSKKILIKLKSDVAAALYNVVDGGYISFNHMIDIGKNIETIRHIIQWVVVDMNASIEFTSQGVIFDSRVKLNILNSLVDFQKLRRDGLQKQGIEIAKELGKFRGRISQFNEDTINEIKEKFSQIGVNKSALAREYGITRQYLYKLVDNNSINVAAL